MWGAGLILERIISLEVFINTHYDDYLDHTYAGANVGLVSPIMC